MATSFPEVQSTTLQKFCDLLASSLVRPDGTKYAAAPNAFKDRVSGAAVNAAVPSGSQAQPMREVKVQFKVNPDGLTATCTIELQGGGRPVESLKGSIDLATLAAGLV